MYKSPISVECEKIAREITEKQDGYIVSETIRLTGVKVDKDELIKALSYDRGQYEKGYADGKADVAEVRHGRWEWNKRLREWYCSNCGRIMTPYTVEKSESEYEMVQPNYCGWCGAKMEGDTE